MFADLPIWAYFLITLALTHVTIAGVTIFLHRHQSHRALNLHPAASHFFRFWLWLTTGMVTKEWVAVHRKHHARVESEEDPHSPQQAGILEVLLKGTELYRRESAQPETLEQFGFGTPDDWIERHLYARRSVFGIVLMLIINVALFGAIGITIWAVQMMWIPFFAAGVINGVGHWWGYRNFESPDASTNIVPLGLVIGGEELHNNHHAYASSARFSQKWYEIDLGWIYIRLLSALGLARVKRLAPVAFIDRAKAGADLDTVRAIARNRMHVMARYASDVVSRVYREERAKTGKAGRRLLRRGRRFLVRHEVLLDARARARLHDLLGENHTLKVVYEYRQRLQALWQQKTATQEALLHALQEWCREAEQTGIEALEEFASTLRGYSLAPA